MLKVRELYGLPAGVGPVPARREAKGKLKESERKTKGKLKECERNVLRFGLIKFIPLGSYQGGINYLAP